MLLAGASHQHFNLMRRQQKLKLKPYLLVATKLTELLHIAVCLGINIYDKQSNLKGFFKMKSILSDAHWAFHTQIMFITDWKLRHFGPSVHQFDDLGFATSLESVGFFLCIKDSLEEPDWFPWIIIKCIEDISVPCSQQCGLRTLKKNSSRRAFCSLKTPFYQLQFGRSRNDDIIEATHKPLHTHTKKEGQPDTLPILITNTQNFYWGILALYALCV